MSTEQSEKTKTAAQKRKPEKHEKSALESAAEVIGSTLGTIAVSTGIARPSGAPAKSSKVGKLPKKNKSKLPRLAKKRASKAAKAKG